MNNQQLKKQLDQLRKQKFAAEKEAIELGIAIVTVQNLVELGRMIGRVENELVHRGEKV